MASHKPYPFLFLDVDGTLLPFGDTSREPLATTSDSLLERLDPQMGGRLAALPCDLIWATTWGDAANTEIAPRIGLPSLPVVNWPEPSTEHDREDQWFGLHWKTRALVEFAGARPFIWVDDEITDADQEWVPTRHKGHALLHPVASSRGLTIEDFTVFDTWLRTL